MVSRQSIQSFVDQVAERFHPRAVILFGSHAYGLPTDDSDVDLLVVMPHRGPSAHMATRIRLACPRSFPMDLIVRSPALVQRRVRMGDEFLREVMSKGIVLHESRGAREQLTHENLQWDLRDAGDVAESRRRMREPGGATLSQLTMRLKS